MKIFLAGGVSGNLKPAWKKTAGPTADDFIEALKKERFLKSESISCQPSHDDEVQRWGGTYEGLFGRERNIPGLYRSDIIRRGL